MKIIGTHDEKTIEQLLEVDKNAIKTALMADGHLGYVMPVGGVAAYDNKVSPMGVGSDIACGNCAIKTDIRLEQIAPDLEAIADEIQSTISFGLNRRENKSKDAPTDHPLFKDDRWSCLPKHERDSLRKKARNQLGTVGSGNHYVDVFSDEENYIWVGVHFGSRGFGHTVASGFMNLAQGNKFSARLTKEFEVLFDLNSEIGTSYWELMSLAGEYAYAGRDWVAMKVAFDILKGKQLDYVHNHHNFAWKEIHKIDGIDQEVVVIRKGATPAFPGQRGFVGGSMGDDSVILHGKSLQTSDAVEILKTRTLQKSLMYSTVHGAGRVMSRSAAKGAVNRKTGELKLDENGNPKRLPRVSQEMMKEWLQKKGVILRGGGVDESPHVYRRLTDVLADQGPTIQIEHTLTPLIVVMAGANEFDPYKD